MLSQKLTAEKYEMKNKEPAGWAVVDDDTGKVMHLELTEGMARRVASGAGRCSVKPVYL